MILTEFSKMRQRGHSFDATTKAVFERYKSHGVGYWSNSPKISSVINSEEFTELPGTLFEAKYLHDADLFNGERRMFTKNSKYAVVPKGSKQTYRVVDEMGNVYREFELPERALKQQVKLHHNQPIIFWAEDYGFQGWNWETEKEEKSTTVIDFKIGGRYEKGNHPFSRVSGGDGFDFSANGIAPCSQNGKYGDGVAVIKMSEESLDFEVIATGWKFPEGLDYAKSSWDGKFNLQFGQKNTAYTQIDAVDHEGNLLLNIYSSRGHSDAFHYIFEDGTVGYATPVKYNQTEARNAGGNTGDNVLITYKGNEDGSLEHTGRVTMFSGNGHWGPLLGGQYAAPAYPQALIGLKHFQYDKNHHQKHPNNPFTGCSVDFPLYWADKEFRLIGRNGCVAGSSVTKQAEGVISPNGKWAIIKFDSDGTGKGRLAIVRMSLRMPFHIREKLFSGEYTEANESEMVQEMSDWYENFPALIFTEDDGTTTPPPDTDPPTDDSTRLVELERENAVLKEKLSTINSISQLD